MELPHIISAKDFTRPQLNRLFDKTRMVKKFLTENQSWVNGRYVPSSFPPKLFGRTMALLFDQPSLRTSSSFETAMYSLGGNCVTYRNASRESSIAKDESLEDTIEMISGNPTVSMLVLRHPEIDAAKRAAKVSSVPVINAGDGAEHPTQALIDLFTIQEALGSVDGNHITLVGDMRARTAKSLLYALACCYNVKVTLVHPANFGLEAKIIKRLRECGFCFQQSGFELPLSRFSQRSDVLYVLRPQTENWLQHIKNRETRREAIAGRLKEYYALCTVNKKILSHMPKNSIVLHPRPRGPELPTEVDSDPRVLHTTQGKNGGPVRIALLEMIHSGEWQKLAIK